MNLEQWITVFGLLLTNAGVLFGMWRYFDARISRVYIRLDEVKEKAEKDFVRKDLCKMMHDNTTTNLTGLENRISDRFEKLEKKVEESFDMILELLKKK